MSLFCQSCGNEVASQYRFCPACGGRSLGANPPLSATPIVPAPPPMPATAALPVNPSPTTWTPPPTGPMVGAPRQSYAGFWRRLAAYLIDLFIFMAFFFCIGVVLAIVAPGADPSSIEPVFNVIGVLAFWVYYANMESGPRQATFGKRAMGLRVCDLNGQPLTFGRASGRFFGKLLSGLLLGIGFLMIAFTARKQGLHDQMASALVLHVGE